MSELSGAVGQRPRTAQSALLAGLALIAGVVVLLWYAPDSYSIYKTFHVIAAVVWVGGDITLTTLGIVFERRGDAETLATLGKLGAWIGVRVYTPAAFAVFAFGVALSSMAAGAGDRPGLNSRSPAGRRDGRGSPVRRPRAREDRPSCDRVRAAVRAGRQASAASVHGVSFRHRSPRPHRLRHDPEACVLTKRKAPVYRIL